MSLTFTAKVQVPTSLYTDLALDALKMATWRRENQGAHLDGLIRQSDRDVQYRAIRYTRRLTEAGAVASVGAKGDVFHNAVAEATAGCRDGWGGVPSCGSCAAADGAAHDGDAPETHRPISLAPSPANSPARAASLATSPVSCPRLSASARPNRAPLPIRPVRPGQRYP
ncbi:hypothetical protein Axi01nite_94860 [Actinoplanes xinjiangensis]|nr:hypothetical protein Axi01nite_94860 [Actinoplanes xinjiangensis]